MSQKGAHEAQTALPSQVGPKRMLHASKHQLAVLQQLAWRRRRGGKSLEGASGGISEAGGGIDRATGGSTAGEAAGGGGGSGAASGRAAGEYSGSMSLGGAAGDASSGRRYKESEHKQARNASTAPLAHRSRARHRTACMAC